MILSKSLPIAEQVTTALRRRIRELDYAPGARLPAESELAQEFGVSRATLRTALARLAAEGVIIRRQGDGTFVNENLQHVNASLGGMLNFWHLIEASGKRPAIQPIAVGERPATAVESAALDLPDGAPVLALTRIFLADDAPFILATNSLPLALVSAPSALYDGRLSLPRFLARYCDLTIAYAIYTVHADAADGSAAEFLEIAAGTPLLRIVTTFYDRANRPIVYGLSHYRADVLPLRFVQAWV